MNRFPVRQVAVLGAGVMGAQIAAHLINVGVPVCLFDLPAKEGPANGIAQRAIVNLGKLKPAPLALADLAPRMQAANYDSDLARLAECDLIIEAIAERMEWKHDLYARIAPHVAKHAVLASNTSGLSIAALADGLPEELRPRFCGVHFFNPPRYMPLVELIAAPATQPEVIDQLETFVTRTLGKSVVRAKDTPNFIANRVGVAGMLAVMHEAQQFQLSYDLVDDLTGKKLGRASSGTFRTADVVGLDTMAHVIGTMQNTLSLETDPFYASFQTPAVLQGLIQAGALGQKTKAGFFKKEGSQILRLDAASGQYVGADAKADPLIDRILKRPAPERLQLLRESDHPQAQFLWAVLRNSFHYAAVHLSAIANSARDLDFAMHWGFGMKQGPFELWQEAGWGQVTQWMQADIKAGKTLCAAPLPAWVMQGPVAQAQGVHTAEGSWSPSMGQFVGRTQLPVYARQKFPEALKGEALLDPLQAGREVFRNDELRLWTLDEQILIASITAKLHLISPAVTAGLHKAVALAQAQFDGLVIWSPDEVFSAGANLEALMPVFMQQGVAGITQEQQHLQNLMLALRYAQIPVVAAMRGLALGGGCELALHCSRRVAHLESYIGLVEVGVGLLPGAGGLTYMARRAAERAQAGHANGDCLPFLKDIFMHAATAKVSGSAVEARDMGYLQEGDCIVAHKDELLHVALEQAKAMAASNWRAPLPAQFAVAGRTGWANMEAQLVNMLEGGLISEHDHTIVSRMAQVVCGGDVDPGSVVTEPYLMALEREHFAPLIAHPKTQERIMGMLSSGKPVRN